MFVLGRCFLAIATGLADYIEMRLLCGSTMQSGQIPKLAHHVFVESGYPRNPEPKP